MRKLAVGDFFKVKIQKQLMLRCLPTHLP